MVKKVERKRMRIDLKLKYRNSCKQFAQDIKRAQAILLEPFSIPETLLSSTASTPFNVSQPPSLRLASSTS